MIHNINNSTDLMLIFDNENRRLLSEMIDESNRLPSTHIHKILMYPNSFQLQKTVCYNYLVANKQNHSMQSNK